MNTSALPFGTLTIDHNVELPERTAPNNTGRESAYAGYKDALLSLAVGDGFFIGTDSLKSTNGLYNFAKTLGVNMARGYSEQDATYGKQGVTFVRISDEAALKRKRKPKGEQADGSGQAAPAGDDNEL